MMLVLRKYHQQQSTKLDFFFTSWFSTLGDEEGEILKEGVVSECKVKLLLSLLK